MAELVTWCRLMRTGPVCGTPCDGCRITSGRIARSGVTFDPERFYDDPPLAQARGSESAAPKHAAAVLDERFADVLARAAAVPRGMSVDETIRHVVEHSNLRLTFPPDFDPAALRAATPESEPKE